MSDKSRSQEGMSFAGRVFVFCSPEGVISVTRKMFSVKTELNSEKKENASFL